MKYVVEFVIRAESVKGSLTVDAADQQQAVERALDVLDGHTQLYGVVVIRNAFADFRLQTNEVDAAAFEIPVKSG